MFEMLFRNTFFTRMGIGGHEKYSVYARMSTNIFAADSA